MKSNYLETLEKLHKALTVFDMSFSVSNKVFRLAIVAEILDTVCLFEQLYNSWSEHLPFGEGPDADVDFAYWKEYSTWETLLDSAQQNACIDDYPVDMGNGIKTDMIHTNRRKNYLKSIGTVLSRSKFSGKEAASNFVKVINSDKSHMMTFGNMVFEALSPLLLVLSKIDNLLANPDKSLFPDYFERQKNRFDEICDENKSRIQGIINENRSSRRKCNKLNALRDELWKNLYESKFLDALKDNINTYDISDYHIEHPKVEKTEEEIRKLLAFEELVDINTGPNEERTGHYIFKNRNNLSFEDISSFFVYLYVKPLICTELEKLNVEQSSGSNHQKNQNEFNQTLSSSRQVILDQLQALIDKGEWASGTTSEDVKGMIRSVLGLGVTSLKDEEVEKSETLWQLLENGRGDRVKIVWQNMVGYMDEKKLFRQKGSPALNKDFFDSEEGYPNIDKGRPSRDNMSSGFREILPLLDAYVPTLDKKT